MAWVKEGDLSRFGATGTYAFKSGNQTINTKEILYNSNNIPSGAQFGPNNYMWPLWYEKAFAKLKNCANWVDPKTGKPTNCPNVCNIPNDVGMKSLIEIAVNYGHNNSPGFTIKYPTDTIAQMKQKLDAITIPGAKATRPAVAWTGAQIKEIRSGHTYSYLGYVDKNPDYYIVLRNPCKVEPPLPDPNLLTAGRWPGANGPIDFGNLLDGIFAVNFKAITNGLTIGYVF
jgi:hypothetical protein